MHQREVSLHFLAVFDSYYMNETRQTVRPSFEKGITEELASVSSRNKDESQEQELSLYLYSFHLMLCRNVVKG